MNNDPPLQSRDQQIRERIELIQHCKIFSRLTDEECRDLLKYVKVLTLSAHEVLFHQGDPSDYIYILCEGKLYAYLLKKHGKEKVIGLIEKGETVGELGALSDQSRSLSVKALSECNLLKISREDFHNYCLKNSTVLIEIISNLVQRSQNNIFLLEEKKLGKHIAIIPANRHVSMMNFSKLLKTYCQNLTSLLLLDEKEQNQNILIKNLQEASLQKENILYFIDQYDSPLAQICREHVNVVFVIADSASYQLDEMAIEFIKSRAPLETRCELVLLHKQTINHTKNWLTDNMFHLHHHVRENNDADYNRLLRFIRGKPFGLVLGGGGAKAWAQVGVIKALFEKNVLIDAIGGTSAGAFIAAAYALTGSLEGTYQSALQIVHALHPPLSIGNFTFPIISLIDARKGTHALQQIFAEQQIEDLSIPFFCMSCNLNQRKGVVHQQGLLWKMLRASASVPGISPPVVLDGQLHIDGGVVNNIPVDVMRKLLGDTATIMAVNLNNLHDDKNVYVFPPILTLKDTLLYKMHLRHNEFKFPPLFDTFINSMQVGAFGNEKINSLNADILINPNLVKYKMLDLDFRLADKLIEIGYKTTLEQLSKWKKSSLAD